MAKNPIIYNDGGVHRFIDYVSQVPEFMKAEDDVVVLLQVLSDYVNNAYRNISKVEVFEFNFIAIDSNLIEIQTKVNNLRNLFKTVESRKQKMLYLAKPQGNKYIESRPACIEIIKYTGAYSTTLDASLINQSLLPVNGDKVFIEYISEGNEKYSSVYVYDSADNTLNLDEFATSQDPFTDTPNRPISSNLGLVPRIIQFDINETSDLHTKKAKTVDTTIYYNVYFTANISNIEDITSVHTLKYDIDADDVTENMLLDYYDILPALPSSYDDYASIKFGNSCETFSWDSGYGKGIFYARELSASSMSSQKNSIISKDVYSDPIFANNTTILNIISIGNMSGSKITIKVIGDHGLNIGDVIYISGTNVFDGKDYKVSSVLANDTFTISNAIVGSDTKGKVVIQNLRFSKLTDNTTQPHLKLAYDTIIGSDIITTGDKLYRITPEYVPIQTSFDCVTGVDLIAGVIIPESTEGFYVGDTVFMQTSSGSCDGLVENEAYTIIDMPILGNKTAFKLKGVNIYSTGTGTIQIKKVYRYANGMNDMHTQYISLNSVSGLNVGDIVRFNKLSNFTYPSELVENKNYSISDIDTESNSIKIADVRFSYSFDYNFDVIKVSIDLSNVGIVLSNDVYGVDGTITFSSVSGDVISVGEFIKYDPNNMFPTTIRSKSTAIRWENNGSMIYTINQYVVYNNIRYRVLKTHRSGSKLITPTNNDYFIVDMSPVVLYSKKTNYNPYMFGMYNIKPLAYSDTIDYTLGFDKLYSDLYIRKVEDLQLKYGHEQREFIFDPRLAPTSNLVRNGYMEIIKGNGSHDAIVGDLTNHLNANTQENMMLRGADKNIVINIDSAVKNNGLVTVSTIYPHGFLSDITVDIADITDSEFNGRYEITVTSPRVFTYVIADTDYGVATLTSTSTVTYKNDIICTVESLMRSGTYATVITSNPHGYKSGIEINISGAIESAYNGKFTIEVYDETTFTYQVDGGVSSPATTINGIKSSYIPKVGDYINVIKQYNTSHNGIYIVTENKWSLYDGSKVSVPLTLFTKQNLFDITTVNPVVAYELEPRGIKSLIYSNSVSRLVTAELYYEHNYSVGTVVSISGASQGEYNGFFEIYAIPSSTSFMYKIKSNASPASPATPQINFTLLCQSEMWYKYEISNIEWQQKSNYNTSYMGKALTQITGDGSKLTVVTSDAHELKNGQSITMTNISTDIVNFNGNYLVYEVINDNTFTVLSAITGNESAGNVYSGIIIPSNNNNDHVRILSGEYSFTMSNGSKYKFTDGDIIELHDQYLTRENGIYRVMKNSPWKRLDKRLVMKVREITVDHYDNPDYDDLSDTPIPYVYRRYTDEEVNTIASNEFDVTHQIYKVDTRYMSNYKFAYEKVDNIDTTGQLHNEYNSKYDYNSVTPRNDMKPSFIGVSDLKYPLVEKFERLRYLKDPKVIDMELIEYLARYMGYDITEVKDDIDESMVYTNQIQREKALRETIQNLPQFYALKSTKSSLEMILLSFGIVGELVTKWTRQNDPYSELFPDFEIRGMQIAESMNGKISSFIPTPHFSIKIEIEGNYDNQLLPSDEKRIGTQIRRFKPINTVFDGVYRFLSVKAKVGISLSNMRAVGRMKSAVGYEELVFDEMITNDCMNSYIGDSNSPYMYTENSSSILTETGNGILLE